MDLSAQRQLAIDVAQRTPSAMYVFDFETNQVIYLNDALYNLIGFTPDQVRKMGLSAISELLHPTDQDRVDGSWRHLSSMSATEPREKEFRVRHASGEWLWVRTREVVLEYRENGAIKTVLGALEDITTAREAQDTLAFHRRLERLVTGLSTRFINLSPAETDTAVQSTLRVVSQLIGIQCAHVCRIHDELPTRISMTHEWRDTGVHSARDRFQHLPANLLPWLLEQLRSGQTIKARDLSTLPETGDILRRLLEMHGYNAFVAIPLKVRNKLWGYIGFVPEHRSRVWASADALSMLRIVGEIVVNGIEHKEAADALRHSEERWRSIADTAYDFIAVVDRQGRIIHLNRNVPGFNAEQFVGVSVDEFVMPRYRNALREVIARVIETGEENAIEHEAAGPHGRPTWFRTRIGRYMQDGHLAGVNLFSTIIQSQKDAESRVQQLNRQLEFTTRLDLLGTMATEIAHQLRQPLQVISSHAGGSRRMVKRGRLEPEKLSEALRLIVESSDQASAIIEGIREFVQSRTLKPRLTKVDDVVGRAMTLVEPVFRHHNLRHEVRVESALPRICVDSIQVTMVLVNLIVNAVEAMVGADMNDGRVTVVVRSTDEAVEFSVADTGPGIPDEIKPRIFDQFFSTKVKDGLGVGLAMSREVITTLRGRIWVESQTGRGSVFRFTIPMVESSGTDTAEFEFLRVDGDDDDKPAGKNAAS